MAVTQSSTRSNRTPRRAAAACVSYVDISDEEMNEDDMILVKKRKRVRSPSLCENQLAGEPSSSEDDLEEEEYEVDQIMDSRLVAKGSKKVLEFLIRWKGYSPADDSWTIADQFDEDDPPVVDFYKRFPKKPKLIKAVNIAAMFRSQVKSQAEASSSRPLRHSTQPQRFGSSTPEKALAKESRLLNESSNQPSITSMFSWQSKAQMILPSSTPNSQSTRSQQTAASTPKKGETQSNAKAFGSGVKVQLRASISSKKSKVQSDDDDDFAASESDDDEDFESENEEEEKSEEEEYEEEDDYDEKPKGKKAKTSVTPMTNKKSSGGWGANKIKGPKKAPVKLGNFKTGVKPLMTKDGKAVVKSANMNEDLPPIADVEEMFDHLTSRIPDIVKVVQRLNGRKLRVATMCSGTESPLLALKMIAKAIERQHGLSFEFDHVFSCEIEPFKQAYIERNFAPPILFRDVTELGRKQAHTAYGSIVKVPGDVDILIAGTSCVDYSGLNNEKQDIDANGESGRTFRGMLQWVNKHRPPIVILENVCSAPWDKIVEYFGQVDYDANYCRLDTKEYYIPHTRTRVYLFATPAHKGDVSHLPEKWVSTLSDLKRPWSASFEAFLLPSDDPNIHRARLDLAAARFQNDGTQRKPTDWNRCESRHARARQEELLGVLRPLTSWKEAGVCKGLDWTWNDWLLSQTERVVDLLDISTLRMAAQNDVDSGYKACIWNVSQNVDRQGTGSRTALAPCLTPNMIPWVTIRGGPVTGREALSLQGIPVRELLLTSENEDQLADLAGNAMTSTVVGASMLSALVLAVDKLAPGEGLESGTTKAEDDGEAKKHHIVGEEYLEEHELDLAKVTSANLVEIMDLAERSSRHCQCEGQSGTVTPIDECTLCGYRACKTCGGRPDHAYSPCRHVRVEPREFEKQFKELLPMRVNIAGVTKASLERVRKRAEAIGKGSVVENDWNLWSEALLEGVTDAEFRFRYLKRQNVWTAVYEAPHATLELVLRSTPEWLLTIKSPSSEAVNSRLRTLLLHPVARMRFNLTSQDVLCGPWELCVPSKQSFDILITGEGELVPTWHASIGLQGKHQGTMRWSELRISVPPEVDMALDRKVSGRYPLLPRCGQAMASLHKKQPTQEDEGLSPLFFFLDPDRVGESSDDTYVFTTSIERLEYGTERAIIAKLESKWRESDKIESKVKLNVRGGWVVCDEVHLTAVGGSDIAIVDCINDAHRDTATYSFPRDIPAKLTSDCSQSLALLSVQVPLDSSHAETMWRKDDWGEIDLQHEGNTTFANLAWITERLPSLDRFKEWSELSAVDTSGSPCSRCSPLPPTIHWVRQAGNLNSKGHKTKATIIAFEDRQEASRYEHALKNRPSAFTVQLRLDNQVGSLRIGLNIASLAHRAFSRLPASQGGVKLSWRLTQDKIADLPRPPREFILPSNKRDPEYAHPKSFLLPLRKEQLRSLWWMLRQEAAEGKTHTFVEEEISEAMLPSLGWRAEGKAERPVMVRGGVIADQVGYGKTIISLALVAETKDDPAPEPAPAGLIDLKATLIVVPGHLSKQWPSEITRFTGKLFKTIVIQSMRELNALNIADLSKADIIVMASEVLDSDAYWERFEYLSAQPEDWLSDQQGGRFFADRLNTAMAALRDQTRLLMNDPEEAVENMKTLHERAREDAAKKKKELKVVNFGKRLKGAAYRDKYDADQTLKKSKSAGTSKSKMWEVSEDEEEDEVEEDVAPPKLVFRKASGKDSYSSSSVRANYKLLSAPVMHMFRFRRVIADEFTYLEKKPLNALLKLSSCYKWVLSGTPPVGDFPAIRSIASFMGLHLGVEDDGEGSKSTQIARTKELTQAEKFHAFREMHSSAWHNRRDDLAQLFLNTFVRQNIAEIDEIPTVEHVHEVKLPAAEGAVYLELEHHLQALEMQARKETKFKNVTQGDRNARLEEALTDSTTAEEALLKRSCHFTLDLNDRKRDAKSAKEACSFIAGKRRVQLMGCEDDLVNTINLAVGLHAFVRFNNGWTNAERQPFKEWVELSFDETKHQGDIEAARRLIAILQNRCGFLDGIPNAPADSRGIKKLAKAKPAEVENMKWELREQTHLLRRLSKELVARVRSLRFFEVVRKLQLNGPEAKEILESSVCDHRPSTHPDVEMAVLSCCGHVACHNCMIQAADNQRCPSPSTCHAAIRHTNIVKVKTLGVEGELSSGRYGAKLQRLVDLIKAIPKRERVLVFLQWEDLAHKVSEALTDGGISHLTLSGSVKQRANTLDSFQSDTASSRVLLLKMQDASAAGSNLTTANHAIFLGPLFVDTLHRYRQAETQAIGRIRRYGQLKHVHIHRLLALDTIDMTIYQNRTRELQSKSDYIPIPIEVYVPRGKPSSRSSEGSAQSVMEVDGMIDVDRPSSPPA